MRPSGKRAACPPAATCSSNSSKALSNLRWYSSGDKSSFGGMTTWPILRAMVPKTGILKIRSATAILTRTTCGKGTKDTARIVSRKDTWFARTTQGFPEEPSCARKSSNPSTCTRIQQQNTKAKRHRRQVHAMTSIANRLAAANLRLAGKHWMKRYPTRASQYTSMVTEIKTRFQTTMPHNGKHGIDMTSRPIRSNARRAERRSRALK
mmetsp:Transcript_64368/g.149753  ORF Transcript_64368/g.149753 Transcript_64368/m.149753 type:complete len:208 (+) Transcript_64368:465-1088(+)